MIRAALLALAVMPLAACGFEPVYGTPGSLANAGPISIPEIEGRTGHFLRQELLHTIGPGVPGIRGPGQLEIKLSQSIERLAFAPDQAASRSDYVGSATWSLRSTGGTLLANGSVKERASFNFADSPYADIAAQTEAQQRLATLLARSIRSQMIVQAGKPPGSGVEPPKTSPIVPALPGSTPASLPQSAADPQ